ncbi:hypothetical protein PDO_1900 [Rhizobium sp. PDO1-076]|uniref:hypothetical protein n=1 Tax=Rhizobium sp. PDO1-076 TaxID=1125979 RepID=UPI00024E35CD|nr:hypothetical protein [Rhizobium sp. PDO1-076]EHS51509.1 hypothetical protein PDO_1900 [Rhizobium sp. PDO1-076]
MNRTYLLIAGVLAAVVAIAALGLGTVSKIEGMVSDATTLARSERDHYWRAQVETMNAQAQAKIATNLRETMAAQNAARDQIADAEARAVELEKQNAALPNSSGPGRGLGRERVRLLNKR